MVRRRPRRGHLLPPATPALCRRGAPRLPRWRPPPSGPRQRSLPPAPPQRARRCCHRHRQRHREVTGATRRWLTPCQPPLSAPPRPRHSPRHCLRAAPPPHARRRQHRGRRPPPRVPSRSPLLPPATRSPGWWHPRLVLLVLPLSLQGQEHRLSRPNSQAAPSGHPRRGCPPPPAPAAQTQPPARPLLPLASTLRGLAPPTTRTQKGRRPSHTVPRQSATGVPGGRPGLPVGEMAPTPQWEA